MAYAAASVLARALVALAIALLAAPFSKAIINIIAGPFSWLNNGLTWLVNKAVDAAIHLTHSLGPEFEVGLNPLVRWFHISGQNSLYTHHAIKRTGTQLDAFAGWLVKHHIPLALKDATAGVQSSTLVKVRAVPLSKAQLRTLETAVAHDLARQNAAAIPGIVAKPFPQINWTPRQWRKWLGLGALGGALALPGTTAWDRTKWKDQAKTNHDTHKKFRTLSWMFAFTSAAALVTAALTKMGLGWMPKCKNLKRIGPAFCGANLGGLIGLFGALALIEGGFSIVTLAEEMLAIEGQMVKVIGGAFSELDGLV